MNKPPKEFDSLHKELSQFNAQIDKKYPLETWLTKTKTISTLIQKTDPYFLKKQRKSKRKFLIYIDNSKDSKKTQKISKTKLVLIF